MKIKIKNLIIKNIILQYKKILKKHKSKLFLNLEDQLLEIQVHLISKIIYIKKSDKKNFIILDAAMNDLMRPALYGAKHKILPVIKKIKNQKKLMNLLVLFVKVQINFLH